MVEKTKLTLGYSPLSGNIYAGKSKPVEGAPHTRQFTGGKIDVTEDALIMVAEKLRNENRTMSWELPDGIILTLAVTTGKKAE